MDDLIQSGSIGLIKAAKEFVPEGKKRFLFYAQHDIKRSIFHYINYENNFFGFETDGWVEKCKSKKIKEYIKNFIHENQREPEKSDIVSIYDEIYPYGVYDNLGKADYYEYMQEGNLSLDKSIKELSKEKGVENIIVEGYMGDSIKTEDLEDDIYLRDLLVDEESEKWQPMDMESLGHDLNEIVFHKFGFYEGRKREILKKFYGLEGDKERDIDEIAKHCGVLRESIRQQKFKALKRLEYSKRVQEILSKYKL